MLTTLSALAAGPWGRGPGYGPGPFFLLGPLLWLVVIVVVALLVRRGVRRRWAEHGGPHGSPEATLSDRFATGQIDEVEYRSRLEVLRANRPRKR